MAIDPSSPLLGAACVDRVLPSPSGRERVPPETLRYVIIHGTWMPDDELAMARLRDPAVEVSAHYYIARDGGIIQMVDENRVAFHAGKSHWNDTELGEISSLNGWSLGIEIGNAGPFFQPPTVNEESRVSAEDWLKAEPYTEAQYSAVVRLLSDILSRYPAMNPSRVLGHSEIAPGRKIDPGPHFDWGRLCAAGVCRKP